MSRAGRFSTVLYDPALLCPYVAPKIREMSARTADGPTPDPNADDGVARALEQTAGWTDFLCSLKAHVLHGINLREGRVADKH